MSLVPPPTGFRHRVATPEDCDAIADLVNESNVAEIGAPWTTPERVRDGLEAPGHEPEDDTVLVGASVSPAAGRAPRPLPMRPWSVSWASGAPGDIAGSDVRS